MNLDLVAQYPQGLRQTAGRFLLSRDIAGSPGAFIALWEVQSKLATFAYLGLVAFTSIWITLAAMLVWSVVATLVFCHARECGYPNILGGEGYPRGRLGLGTIWFAIVSVARALLGGVNAFIFTRFSGAVLKNKAAGRPRRLLRGAVLGVGMTMFGVTVAEHLLRSAGYSGSKLRRLAVAAPFLNVPYRVLMGAAFIAFVRHSFGVL